MYPVPETLGALTTRDRRESAAPRRPEWSERPGRSAVVSMLREFGPGIWTTEGPVVPFFGFPYPTRMAVIRLSNGGLFVWSPIALSLALKREIDALGPVRCLVSPNLLHHLFLAEWKAAYPDARLFAAPGLRRRRKDLAFDADLGDAPDPLWAADVDQVLMRGSFAMTEVVFFHRASGAAIFADLIQNFPRDWFKGWRALLAPPGWHRRAPPRRAARLARQLHRSPRGARRAGAHTGLADPARADRPRGTRIHRWRGIRSRCFRLAVRSTTVWRPDQLD